MLMDERGEFADATALNTGAPGQFLIGDVIDLQALDSTGTDLGSAAQDLAGGDGGMSTIYVVITIDTAVVQAGGTLRFKVVSDSVAAIAVDGTATEHVTTHDFTPAELVAGARFALVLPPEIPVYERFLGVIQESIGAAVTAGAINAFISRDIGSWKSYPDAQN